MNQTVTPGPNAQPIPALQAAAVAAYRECLEQNEPRFVPAAVFVDDRGWSIMNQLQGVLTPEGQINYSTMYPGVVKAWHRHRRQTDFWLCVSGHLKVGVHRDDGRSWQAVVGEKRPGVVIIPPPLWHGAATVGHLPSGLLYYVTEAYDPRNPDEERRPHDSVEGFAWAVKHR